MGYNELGGDCMTAREIGFIKAAARGLRLAQEHLKEDPMKYLAMSQEAMASDYDNFIGNHDIAYFAAMLVAWEDMGKPDLLT